MQGELPPIHVRSGREVVSNIGSTPISDRSVTKIPIRLRPSRETREQPSSEKSDKRLFADERCALLYVGLAAIRWLPLQPQVLLVRCRGPPSTAKMPPSGPWLCTPIIWQRSNESSTSPLPPQQAFKRCVSLQYSALVRTVSSSDADYSLLLLLLFIYSLEPHLLMCDRAHASARTWYHVSLFFRFSVCRCALALLRTGRVYV